MRCITEKATHTRTRSHSVNPVFGGATVRVGWLVGGRVDGGVWWFFGTLNNMGFVGEAMVIGG